MKKQITENDWLSLQEYFKSEIEGVKQQITNYLAREKQQRQWSEVKSLVSKTEPLEFRERLMEAVAAINVFPLYLTTLNEFVFDSPEHLKNYLNHQSWKSAQAFGQSVVLVSQRLRKQLVKWSQLKAKQLIEDEVMMGLIKIPIEEQIYLEASRMDEIEPFFKTKRKYKGKKES